jgi:phosphoglycolate phosphatase-like HAD superfamily hydrolase
MEYDAVLFDWDGTLGETTAEGRYCLLNSVLSQCGGCADPVTIDRFWYETNRDGIVRAHFGVEPEVFWPVYRQHDRSDIRKQFLSCYPDIVALKEIKVAVPHIGIVSGAPYEIVEYGAQMIAQLADEEIFKALVVATDDNGLRRKPHPDGLLKCLEMLGARPGRSIYVGNGEEDVLAARNAGMTDVLIERGEYNFDVKATHRIKTLGELVRIIGANGHSAR